MRGWTGLCKPFNRTHNRERKRAGGDQLCTIVTLPLGIITGVHQYHDGMIVWRVFPKRFVEEKGLLSIGIIAGVILGGKGERRCIKNNEIQFSISQGLVLAFSSRKSRQPTTGY